MNEASFWAGWVKPALHQPTRGRVAKKLSTMLAGLPDVLACMNGHVHLIELKYVPEAPKRPRTPVRLNVSEAQRRHLQEWDGAGGNAWLLVGVGREWLLLHWRTGDAPLEDLRQDALAHGTLTRASLEDLAGLLSS